jgi:hypothetical protein
MITAEHFAELLYRANMAEEVKSEIMTLLPTLSKEKIEAIYETLVNFDQRAQQMLLSFQVDLGEQMAIYQKALQ